MSKRPFEILDAMNLADEKNKTEHLAICSTIISANKAKGGAHITMGVPESYLYDIMQKGKKKVILMIIEASEYDKYSDQF
jgi:hypothetical protein